MSGIAPTLSDLYDRSYYGERMAEPSMTAREERTIDRLWPESKKRPATRERLEELVREVRPEEGRRHASHRKTGPDDRDWVVTLVAEQTPEEHIADLIEAVAYLASVKGEDGVPLARSRVTQRQLMKRGIAVTL